MGVYDINMDRLAAMLLPAFLRKPLMTAFAKAMAHPSAVLHGRFMQWRAGMDTRLGISGQTCRLRALLNDTFDPVLRRITVEDAPAEEAGIFLWREELDRPVMLGTQLIMDPRFAGTDGVDFIVRVPAAVGLDEAGTRRMDALARQYRLAGKRHLIKTVI